MPDSNLQHRIRSFLHPPDLLHWTSPSPFRATASSLVRLPPFRTLSGEWLFVNQIWTCFFPAHFPLVTPHGLQGKTQNGPSVISPSLFYPLHHHRLLLPLATHPGLWLFCKRRGIFFTKLCLLCRGNHSWSQQDSPCISKSSGKDCLAASWEHRWKDSHIGWEVRASQTARGFSKTANCIV